MTTGVRIKIAPVVGLALVLLLSSLCKCAPLSYEYSFDQAMSWADDISPWGMREIQNWEIADGGNPGKALRISAAAYKQPRSFEGRTLQFNHNPGTRVRISFDVREVSSPPGSVFLIRYFDGYCGGMPFVTVAEDDYRPFPAPIWDSRNAERIHDWQHVEATTPKLENTVLTLFMMAQQPEAVDGQFIEFLLDNLRVETTALDRFMDPGFDWHGNTGGSTLHFWRNTGGADADWCDFADQENVVTEEGTVRYTLAQFRDTSWQFTPSAKHQLIHEKYNEQVSGYGTVTTSRIHADNTAASWGVRQTVAYSAFGLKRDQAARLRVKMRYTNHEAAYRNTSRVQLGVDPLGGTITREALWGTEDNVNFTNEGWRVGVLEFNKPTGAEAFTVYFRHRDGQPKPGGESPHELQSKGTDPGCRGVADWVMVEVLTK